MKTIILIIGLLSSTINAQQEYIRFNFITKESGKVIGIARDDNHLRDIVEFYNKNNNGKRFEMHPQGVQKQWAISSKSWDYEESNFRLLSDNGNIYHVISSITLKSVNMINKIGIEKAAASHVDRMDVIRGKNVSYDDAIIQIFKSSEIIKRYGINNKGIHQSALQYASKKTK